MIKHIVMMKLKRDENSDFQKNILKLETMLNALKSQIDCIKNFEVGINISDRPAAYDIVLVAEFDNAEDLSIYRFHPDHTKVVEFIREVVADSKVIDYQI